MPSSKPSFEYALSSDEVDLVYGFYKRGGKSCWPWTRNSEPKCSSNRWNERDLDMGANRLSSMLPGSI